MEFFEGSGRYPRTFLTRTDSDRYHICDGIHIPTELIKPVCITHIIANRPLEVHINVSREHC